MNLHTSQGSDLAVAVILQIYMSATIIATVTKPTITGGEVYYYKLGAPAGWGGFGGPNIRVSKGQSKEAPPTPHDPIYIDGNAGFTPENGVNGGGSGTENDPAATRKGFRPSY